MQYNVWQDGEEIEKMVKKTRICLNCGSVLKRTSERAYCCMACKCAKPPKMAYLERKHNKPIRSIVLDMLNEYKDQGIVADMLDLHRYTLKDWLDKLNIKRKVIFE